MALGVPPSALARRPLLLGAQIALAGVALGIPVGLAADAWLAGVMDDFFPLPVVRASFQPDVHVQGALLRLTLPLLVAAVPVWRALRVTPIDAIHVGARSARSSGLAWLVKGLRLPGGTLANLPLRNVLRTPRRTLMTLLGIAAGGPDRLTVDLASPQPDGAPAVRRVTSKATVGPTQPSLRLASTLIAHRRRLDVALETIADKRPLWHPTLHAGALPSDRPGLVIAKPAAETLAIAVGDRVSVLHPVPSGTRSFRLARTTLPVAAIHTSQLRFIAYINRPGAAALGVAGLVNRISVVPAPGNNADDVKGALLRQPTVAAVQGAAATTDAVASASSSSTRSCSSPPRSPQPWRC